VSLENIPQFESEEQELRSLLAELHNDHQRRIAPILARLAAIDQLDQLLKKFRDQK
jgi:hypothetical protein